jgi:hypothetical protein
MTFKIEARCEKVKSGKFWIVSILGDRLFMTDAQWRGFRSLLSPSTDADFEITEVGGEDAQEEKG